MSSYATLTCSLVHHAISAAVVVLCLFSGCGVPGVVARGSACPEEGSGLASAQGGDAALGAVFVNRAAADVSLLWVDFGGQEQLIEEVAAGASSRMNSFAGHVWRVRDGASGRLLLEEVMQPAVKVQHFSIVDCMDNKRAAALDSQSVAADREWLQQGNGARDGPALAGCPLSVLLSEDKVQGFHVMCAVAGPNASLRLCIFQDGKEAQACTHSVALNGNETLKDVTDTALARVRPHWKLKPRAPPPALFTASGRRLPASFSLAEVGVPSYRQALVLIEGGQWHWPPVRVGFERPLHSFIHSGLGGIKLRTLALRPRVFEVKSFIEEGECDRMLEKAGPHVRKSAVVVKDSDHGKDVDEWRSSFNYFLDSSGDTVLESLDERVQNLTRIPIVHSEYAQVLKYEYMGRYTAHTDYFDPRDYQKDQRTLGMTANGVHNRLLTVFMYMSNVEKGGQTIFPAHGGKPPPSDYGDCSSGYAVFPERQKVIIFYNMHPSGKLDPDSLHGGCRVLNGTKWSANFWVWNVPQSYKKRATHRRMAEQLQKWERHRDEAEELAVAELAGLPAQGMPGSERKEL